MTNLLRAELRKLTTVRSALAVAGGVLVVAVLGILPAWTAPAAEKATFQAHDLVAAVRGPAFLVGAAALVLGVLATAGEARHGTMASTLLVAPRRRRLAAAKVASVASVAAVMAVGSVAITGLLGTLVLESAGVATASVRGDVALTALAVVGIAVVYAAAGVGLGLAVRDQTAAIAGALVWVTVVENVLPIVLRAPTLSRWMPGGAARSVLTAVAPEPDLLAPAVGAALLVAVVGGLVSVGITVFGVRDID